MSIPKRITKRQDSGITKLRMEYANSFPILFNDIEEYVDPEKIEDYRGFINLQITKKTL